MPQLEISGKNYEVDEDGFLQELDKWTKDFAQGYASIEGIEGELTEEHWKLIEYIRDYYKKVRHSSYDQKKCSKDTGLDLEKDLMRSSPPDRPRGPGKLDRTLRNQQVVSKLHGWS